MDEEFRENLTTSQSQHVNSKSSQNYNSGQHSIAAAGADSRFPRLDLVDLRILVPEPALVSRPAAQIPRLHHKALRFVDIVLVAQLLNADLHSILGENHVLLLHLLVGGGLHVAYY